MNLSRPIAAIDRAGVLLVYPLKDRGDPSSLFRALHPRAQMRWAWDEGADQRVVELWHLREQLARTKKVVYTKWFANRATLFSRDLFRSMLAILRATNHPMTGLSSESHRLIEVLEEDSPRGTKALREAASLQGKLLESTYHRAMRPLWQRLLVVGAGEAEEGGFPSLRIGATPLLFEDLWNGAAELRTDDEARVAEVSARSPAFARAWKRVLADLRGAP